MANIAIVGAGRMGTAMTWPLCDNGHRVRLVGTHLDNDIIRSCRDQRFHPGLRRRIPEGVEPFCLEQIADALADVDVIVSGVNSLGVHWIGRTLAPLLRPGATVLSLTKGVEAGADGVLRTLPEVLALELLPALREQVAIAAVAGPVLAYELAGRRQSAAVFTGRDADTLHRLRALFQNSYYHIWLSTDVTGVEAFAALKNAYVVAIAAAGGMLERAGGVDETGAAMHNWAAGLFGASAYELARIVTLLGGRPENAAGLPGAGDLFVTVTGGRTFRLGRLLGVGLTYSQAQAELAEPTLEGAFVIRQMARILPAWEASGVIGPRDLPLMRRLCRAVCDDVPLQLDLDGLFDQKVVVG